jgi:hypothetical protein
VVHAAQQFHDFFDVAADGVGVYCIARRWHLDADEELFRKRDFCTCGVYRLAGSESCVQWEVERHYLAADDDLGSHLAINGVQDFVANNGRKSEDNGQRVRVTDAQQAEATPSTAQVLNTPSTANSEIPRPRALRHTAPNSLTTSILVDAVPATKAASASRGLPANFARPAHKTYIDSGLLKKSTGKSLRGDVGGDFEEVSKAELDEEFDVLDNEGPSAADGAIKGDYSLSAGWEDDE